MKIIIHNGALDDLRRSAELYDEQAPRLGDHFLKCLAADIRTLREYAGIHERVGWYLRLIAKRFPFAIYDTIDQHYVRVHAVLDSRRDPEWIRLRLERDDWS